MSITKIQQKYDAFVAYFEEHMPVAESELRYENPYQLLVAVILSAQCTDKRVNMTTPTLFYSTGDGAIVGSGDLLLYQKHLLSQQQGEEPAGDGANVGEGF